LPYSIIDRSKITDLSELEIGKILEIKEEKVKIILKKFGISDENYFW